jgi:hypothetical protein
MDEKIQFVQATVEIIHRVFTIVEGVYHNFKEPHLKQVFCRLLDTCFVLDLFVEVEDVARPGLPSPSSLRKQVINTLVEVLRGFGNAAFCAETQGPYHLLRLVGHEIIRVNQGEFHAFEMQSGLMTGSDSAHFSHYTVAISSIHQMVPGGLC